MYRVAVSCPAAEDSLALLLAHPVKVIRHGDLTRHQAESANLSAGWSAKGRDFYHWFSSLRNNKRFSL